VFVIAAEPFRGALLCALLMSLPGIATADSILGIPVTGISSTTQSVPNCPTLKGQVCYDSTTGKTTFYIPLSSSNSGVYGVTPVSGGAAGTFADIGSGTSNALTMYLMFSPVSLPVQTATLTFLFTDLDLMYVNDPAGFFETVQFFSQTGTQLTPLITANGQSGTSPIPFTVSGNANTQTIFFSNVTSILQNPFFVKLTFGSSYYTTGLNTPEDLIATLNTTQAPTPTAVPEPATLLQLASGMLGTGLRARRKLRR
jgi:hypothetical protein